MAQILALENAACQRHLALGFSSGQELAQSIVRNRARWARRETKSARQYINILSKSLREDGPFDLEDVGRGIKIPIATIEDILARARMVYPRAKV